MPRHPPWSPLFPYTTLFRSVDFTRPIRNGPTQVGFDYYFGISASLDMVPYTFIEGDQVTDRKSTRLNSSHVENSYAVFCLQKKTTSGLLPTTAPPIVNGRHA